LANKQGQQQQQQLQLRQHQPGQHQHPHQEQSQGHVGIASRGIRDIQLGSDASELSLEEWYFSEERTALWLRINFTAGLDSTLDGKRPSVHPAAYAKINEQLRLQRQPTGVLALEVRSKADLFTPRPR